MKIKYNSFLHKVLRVLITIVLVPYVLLSSIIITIGFSLLWFGCSMAKDKPINFTTWNDIKRYWKFW